MTVEDLKNLGANVDEGLERCMNNETFYLSLVQKVIDKTDYEKMKAEYDSGDIENAFRTAHDLKGVLGNLSLTPLFVPVSELTELFRNGGVVTDDNGCFDELFTQLEKFRAING